MKTKIKLIGILALGLILLGMPPLYAGDAERPASDMALEEATQNRLADLAEIAANREAVIEEIVAYWSVEANGWEEQFSINVSQADDSKLLALRNAESFDEVQAILEGGTPETLGDLGADLVYTPVTPCKIVDTRFGGGGFIFPGQTRNYQTYGSLGFQGGSFCSSPRGEPSAVHMSMVAVTPNGQGNLKAHPYLTSSSAGLSVNFAPIGTNLANAGTVGVTRSSGFDISITAQNAGAHVTVQVLGYYYPAAPVFIDEGFTAGSGAIPTNTTQFLASPTQVTVTRSNQKIYVVSNKAFGAGATAAASLDLWICYRQLPAGTIQTVGGGSLGIRVPANTRVPMGLSAFISVSPGNYDVGLCGDDNGNGNWTSNEWGYTTAFVVED